jgi:hypothetical protein
MYINVSVDGWFVSRRNNYAGILYFIRLVDQTHTRVEVKIWVSLARGPPPFIPKRRLPPVAARMGPKIMLSMIPLPGRPAANKAFFADNEVQNRFLLTMPLDSILPMMPFLTDSQTAGTPTMRDGLNSARSPLQLRTEASVSVFGDP